VSILRRSFDATDGARGTNVSASGSIGSTACCLAAARHPVPMRHASGKHKAGARSERSRQYRPQRGVHASDGAAIVSDASHSLRGDL
jgi:thiamine monophosphate kinase